MGLPIINIGPFMISMMILICIIQVYFSNCDCDCRRWYNCIWGLIVGGGVMVATAVSEVTVATDDVVSVSPEVAAVGPKVVALATEVVVLVTEVVVSTSVGIVDIDNLSAALDLLKVAKSMHALSC